MKIEHIKYNKLILQVKNIYMSIISLGVLMIMASYIFYSEYLWFEIYNSWTIHDLFPSLILPLLIPIILLLLTTHMFFKVLINKQIKSLKILKVFKYISVVLILITFVTSIIYTIELIKKYALHKAFNYENQIIFYQNKTPRTVSWPILSLIQNNINDYCNLTHYTDFNELKMLDDLFEKSRNENAYSEKQPQKNFSKREAQIISAMEKSFLKENFDEQLAYSLIAYYVLIVLIFSIYLIQKLHNGFSGIMELQTQEE